MLDRLDVIEALIGMVEDYKEAMLTPRTDSVEVYGIFNIYNTAMDLLDDDDLAVILIEVTYGELLTDGGDAIRADYREGLELLLIALRKELSDEQAWRS